MTKPQHPWTNGQVERINRTIKNTTVERAWFAGGMFTSGGAKASAYAVYSALTDSNDQGVKAIRAPAN